MKTAKSILIIALLLCCTATYGQTGSKTDMKKMIDGLMEKMTLDEKLGQLNLPTAGDFATGELNSSGVRKKIEDGLVGGLFNIKSVAKIKAYQTIAVQESRLKIPLLFGMDVIHGYQTVFPIPLAQSCSWDPELIRKCARIAAVEASADGINWTFSPMLDICRDPRWGRIAEGAGEDPFLASKVGVAMVKGYQGDNLADRNTLMSCVKHFALYGASEAGRDYNTTDMSRIRMYNEYLPPYKAAVEAGAGSVMASFNEIDGVPATANKWLLTDLLRKQWGFKGFVVSDYTGISEMIDHGLGNLRQVSMLALKAGVNMDMVSEGFLSTLKISLKEGKITQQEIDAACRGILEAKYKLGLFDDPYRYCDETRAKQELFTPEHLQLAREAAAKSSVLLKNEGNVLPLKSNLRIAVVGPMANNRENMTGTWSVAADFSQSVTLVEGIRQVAGDQATISWAKGSNFVENPDYESRFSIFGKPTQRDNRPEKELIAEAVAKAQNADVVV
ncbi:MAG: glycoside hydrolase family 3 C-terminal domain-containing protein, partial [Marinilabiliales bacterium]|nr:glycoside hydrolase family 3 C-terminal domain-containing protein [Marinilabiliales bacterium]